MSEEKKKQIVLIKEWKRQDGYMKISEFPHKSK
jgi:hypothetical protein